MSHDPATVYRAYLAVWNAATEADRLAIPRIGRVPRVPAVGLCSPFVRTSVTLCAERPPCAARTNTLGHALSALPLPPFAYGRGYVPIYDIQGSSDEPT